MCKLINRIPGSRLLISSGLTSVLEALPGKLDIKRHSPSIRYLSCRATNYLVTIDVCKGASNSLLVTHINNNKVP